VNNTKKMVRIINYTPREKQVILRYIEYHSDDIYENKDDYVIHMEDPLGRVSVDENRLCIHTNRPTTS